MFILFRLLSLCFESVCLFYVFMVFVFGLVLLMLVCFYLLFLFGGLVPWGVRVGVRYCG